MRHIWDILFSMEYKWDICLGLIRACLRIIRKYKKTGNPHKQRISGISWSEASGIRTPDNLIKSQVIRKPIVGVNTGFWGCLWDTFETSWFYDTNTKMIQYQVFYKKCPCFYYGKDIFMVKILSFLCAFIKKKSLYSPEGQLAGL